MRLYAQFLQKNHEHPCEKSFIKIIECSCKEGFCEEISEFLNEADLNALNPNALKELFSILKISSKCELASKIIMNIPLENASISYFWEYFITNFAKNNEVYVRNVIKTVAKINIPEKNTKIEGIYGIFLEFLMKNK